MSRGQQAFPGWIGRTALSGFDGTDLWMKAVKYQHFAQLRSLVETLPWFKERRRCCHVSIEAQVCILGQIEKAAPRSV